MNNIKKPQVMGILNVTPDSFSDGGCFIRSETIALQVKSMLDAGADIIDIGGESTRPFAEAVSEQVELERVLPAIEEVRRISAVPISIDTRKAAVARAALSAGATMINDISALRHDSDMLEVARSYKGPLIIMHMQGTPEDMQIQPHYSDVVSEIVSFFNERLERLTRNGIARERIILDPGIGFGKTVEHNLTILKNIKEFKKIGCPVLIGHSRKSFIGHILGAEVSMRDCPTAVIAALCARQGVDIIRVHDVFLTRQALTLAQLL